MDISTGVVMRRSTSSGASPALLVRIWTWVLVTSGTASMGSRRSESTPSAATTSHPRMTSARLFREKSTMRWIMGQCSCPPPMDALAASDLRMNPPTETTGSPSARPSTTST